MTATALASRTTCQHGVRRTIHDPAAFERAVLLDAWAAGEAQYWTRRATVLAAARPRRGDYTGRATPSEVTERYERLTAAAQACRNRARVISNAHAFGDVLEHFEDTLTDAGHPLGATA